MPTIEKNKSLTSHHTFGTSAIAAYYTEVSTLPLLESAYTFAFEHSLPVLILGGGSNMLFVNPKYEGLVIRPNFVGIQYELSKGGDILVTCGGSEPWHSFVMHTLAHHAYGLENLSLIPGTVGAAPMQNIGAYGVEIKDVFLHLKAWLPETGKEETFYKEDCQFGYRESIFKKELKNKAVITSVTFRLSGIPNIKTSYGDIQKTLVERGIATPSPKDVSDAVISIRQSKLPDPTVLGNAGSFFKNPEIPTEDFLKIQARFPEIPSYPASQPGYTKVPAGWLIEKAGWKGYRRGDAGVHTHQALVLVNYGHATGAEIWQLAQDVIASVEDTYSIRLSPEVNIIP